MLRFIISRPNTVGVTHEGIYESYAELEDRLERYVELKADQGWSASEFKGSNSRQGTIELTHENIADVILIEWTIVTSEREL